MELQVSLFHCDGSLLSHMTSFCFHALFQVTFIDENGVEGRVFGGITDDMYSEVQGFSVSGAVNVSKLCF